MKPQFAQVEESLDNLREQYETSIKQRLVDTQSYSFQLLQSKKIPQEFLQAANDEQYNLVENEENFDINIRELVDSPEVDTFYETSTSLVELPYSSRNTSLDALTTHHYNQLYDFLSPLERNVSLGPVSYSNTYRSRKQRYYR